MTPQMKKVLQKSQHLIDGIECDLPVGIVDMTDIIQRACVEYAQSIVPAKMPGGVYCMVDSEDMLRLGHNACVDDFIRTIQQDSLDLPTN